MLISLGTINADFLAKRTFRAVFSKQNESLGKNLRYGYVLLLTCIHAGYYLGAIDCNGSLHNTENETMETKTQAKTQSRRRAPRIAGIGRDSARLGVTRQHLRLVLIGERCSSPLLRRYQALRRKHQER